VTSVSRDYSIDVIRGTGVPRRFDLIRAWGIRGSRVNKEVLAMTHCDHDRRLLLIGLSFVPFGGLLRGAPAVAQSGVGTTLPRIVQPMEKTKAAFLARAQALRDQAVSEGDQAYGAVVVRNGVIVGEGRNYVLLRNDPTAHAELLAVRDAARRLGTLDLSECEMYATAAPCQMCQGALYWSRIRRVFTESTLARGFAPELGC
jgi:pyrimidine deaminase RibD-like protein